MKSRATTSIQPDLDMEIGINFHVEKNYTGSNAYLEPVYLYYQDQINYFNRMTQHSFHADSAKKHLSFAENCFAKAAFYLGINYNAIGQYDEAATYFREAAKIALKLNDKNFLSLIALHLGICSSKLGLDIETTLSHFNQALAGFNNCSEANKTDQEYYYYRALSLFYLGQIYNRNKNHAEAFSHLKQALDIFTLLNDIEMQAESCLEMGVSQLQLNHIDEAIHLFTQSRNKRSSLTDTISAADTEQLLGICHLKNKDPDRAILSLTKALKCYQANELDSVAATTHLALGICYVAKLNNKMAKNHLKIALQFLNIHASDITVLTAAYDILQQLISTDYLHLFQNSEDAVLQAVFNQYNKSCELNPGITLSKCCKS